MKKFTSYSPPICLALLLTLSFLISCNRPKDQPETTTFETGQPELNVPALYTGTLPCADCPGIDYQLILEEDQFAEIYNYQDRSPGRFEETGSWKIEADTLTLVGLENLILKRFLLDEEKLILLNFQNEQITGDLAEMYVLKRTGNQSSIREHHKKLAGQGFKFFAGGNEPFWSVKIDSLDKLIFETPDSTQKFSKADSTKQGGDIILKAASESVKINLRSSDSYCQDSMSGYLFPGTVTVILESAKNDTLTGCGLFLNY